MHSRRQEGPTPTSTRSQSQFEEFVEGAPDEIEDDLQVLADAYTVYIEALGDIELDAGETPSAEDLAAAAGGHRIAGPGSDHRGLRKRLCVDDRELLTCR